MSRSRRDFSDYLYDLCGKKGSVREEALRKLIDEFKKSVLDEFVQDYSLTLTHRCERSLKRGSTLEIDLSLQLIGLIAITVEAGNSAHEIYENSQKYLIKVLKFKSSNTIKVLECLGIVTFVGAKNSDETERTMEIIWKFISDESEFKVTRKHPPNVVAAAISAWSLLLANINGCCVNPKSWKGLIPYLMKQLEGNYDEDVNSACIEALGIIFENGSLENFSNEVENYTNLKDLKDDIVKRVSRIVKENAEKLLLGDTDNKKITLTICETKLTLTTFSLMKQMNYLKEFLGYGFVGHMMENIHLHNIFKFVPQTISSDDEEEEDNSNKEPEIFKGVVLHVYEPHIKRKACRKRISMSPSSYLNKGRSQLRNKQRMLLEETKFGEYGVNYDVY